MKKRLIGLVVMVMTICSLSACTPKEEEKVDNTVQDANALMDKYVVTDEEESKAKDALNEDSSDATDESESVDYDALDQALIDQIVADGGTSVSGDEIIAVGGSTVEFRGVTYSTDGFDVYEEGVNSISYMAPNNTYCITITVLRNYFNNSSEATIWCESIMSQGYGNYTSKTTYTNNNDIDFVWYKYSAANKVDNYVKLDVFTYASGSDLIAIEGATYASYDRSEKIYDFVDSIKFD